MPGMARQFQTDTTSQIARANHNHAPEPKEKNQHNQAMNPVRKAQNQNQARKGRSDHPIPTITANPPHQRLNQLNREKFKEYSTRKDQKRLTLTKQKPMRTTKQMRLNWWESTSTFKKRILSNSISISPETAKEISQISSPAKKFGNSIQSFSTNISTSSL